MSGCLRVVLVAALAPAASAGDAPREADDGPPVARSFAPRYDGRIAAVWTEPLRSDDVPTWEIAAYAVCKTGPPETRTSCARRGR